nr:kanamycin nucleotidyltransferase C-terminal domain-containing protein [Bacillus badius]
MSTAGAVILGLHNKQYFTTSAQVLPGAMSFTDRPDGFDELCKMVMSGDLSDSKQIINSCEEYWGNLLNWSANHDYMIKCSSDLPVQSN